MKNSLHAVRGYFSLLLVDLILALGGFPLLHRCIVKLPVRKRQSIGAPDAVGWARSAIASGSRFRRTSPKCLTRSAALVFLLRRAYGIAAKVVIGFRSVPIEGHAWVEVDGMVIDDLPHENEFLVIDRW